MEVIGTQTGLSKREKVLMLKDRLRYFLRHPDRAYRLNSREASDTGRQYTDEAVDAGELACALGRCTPRQQRILGLWLGRGRLKQDMVAQALGLSVITVKREASEAFRRMVQGIWED